MLNKNKRANCIHINRRITTFYKVHFSYYMLSHYTDLVPKLEIGKWVVRNGKHAASQRLISVWTLEYTESNSLIKVWENTLKILQKITHRNIIHIYEIFYDKDRLNFSSEQIDGKMGDFSNDEAMYIVFQLANLLNYFHSNLKVALLSIYSDAFVFTKGLDIKLFNIVHFAKVCPVLEPNLPITNFSPFDLPTNYCPPEILTNGTLSKAIDVYSFAVLVFKIFTNTERNNLRKYLSDLPETVQPIVARCLVANPEDRPTFEQISNAPSLNTLLNKVLNFFEFIDEQDLDSKKRFYTNLQTVLLQFSSRLIVNKLIPKFINQVISNNELIPLLIPMLISCKSKITEAEYNKNVLAPLFASPQSNAFLGQLGIIPPDNKFDPSCLNDFSTALRWISTKFSPELWPYILETNNQALIEASYPKILETATTQELIDQYCLPFVEDQHFTKFLIYSVKHNNIKIPIYLLDKKQDNIYIAVLKDEECASLLLLKCYSRDFALFAATHGYQSVIPILFSHSEAPDFNEKVLKVLLSSKESAPYIFTNYLNLNVILFALQSKDQTVRERALSLFPTLETVKDITPILQMLDTTTDEKHACALIQLLSCNGQQTEIVLKHLVNIRSKFTESASVDQKITEFMCALDPHAPNKREMINLGLDLIENSSLDRQSRFSVCTFIERIMQSYKASFPEQTENQAVSNTVDPFAIPQSPKKEKKHNLPPVPENQTVQNIFKFNHGDQNNEQDPFALPLQNMNTKASPGHQRSQTDPFGFGNLQQSSEDSIDTTDPFATPSPRKSSNHEEVDPFRPLSKKTTSASEVPAKIRPIPHPPLESTVFHKRGQSTLPDEPFKEFAEEKVRKKKSKKTHKKSDMYKGATLMPNRTSFSMFPSTAIENSGSVKKSAHRNSISISSHDYVFDES